MPTSELPAVDQLLPHTAEASRIEPDLQERQLAELYAHPAPAPHSTTGTYVRANMVSSLDGAAWGADHLSGSINNDADFRAFRVQRALTDVVLVGAGTVRAEGYTQLDVPDSLQELRAQTGLAPHIELAVVTASGNLPAQLLSADRPPLLITTDAGARALTGRISPDRVVVTGTDAVDLTAGLKELADRGLQRVLTEGGPHLLADLFAQGLVDELCLTISPLIIGRDSGRITHGLDISAAIRVQPLHLLHSDGVLVGRWRVRDLE